jgi:hypothetical protein
MHRGGHGRVVFTLYTALQLSNPSTALLGELDTDIKELEYYVDSFYILTLVLDIWAAEVETLVTGPTPLASARGRAARPAPPHPTRPREPLLVGSWELGVGTLRLET